MESSKFELKSEAEVKQANYRDGLDVEAERRSEDSVEELEYTSARSVPAATTFYADDAPPTKKSRYYRLWRLNAGVDCHRADGCREDDLHKQNPNEADRARFVEAMADTVRLSDDATNHATNLAALTPPKQVNFVGGKEAWLLAAIVHAVRDFGEQRRVDDEALGDVHDISGSNVATVVDIMDGEK